MLPSKQRSAALIAAARPVGCSPALRQEVSWALAGAFGQGPVSPGGATGGTMEHVGNEPAGRHAAGELLLCAAEV